MFFDYALILALIVVAVGVAIYSDKREKTRVNHLEALRRMHETDIRSSLRPTGINFLDPRKRAERREADREEARRVAEMRRKLGG